MNFIVTATDNCPAVSIASDHAPGSFFPVGTTTVTSTATDASGNTSTCKFTVTVRDITKPAITCPSNITVDNAPGQCGANVSFSVKATDNCPGVSVTSSHASGSLFPIGTTTVTSTASDASGNTSTCTFTVTVKDITKPVITCPSNITVDNAPGQCGANVNFSVKATDNCPGVTVKSSHASGSLFPIGTTTVTSTATDASGNTSTCTFTVTVRDITKPVITCPSNITVDNAPGQCGANVIFSVKATDNCPGVTVKSSHASGSLFPIGATTVTSTATDASGNMSTCTFTVTVRDTTKPVITCPSDFTVDITGDDCGTIVNFIVTANDNCPGVTVKSIPASGSFFLLGMNTVTATATDAAGNTSTCTFTVTVRDANKPLITCPSDITVNNAAGQCGANVNFTVSAIEKCSRVTVKSSPASGTFFPIGTTTVTSTATDEVGNTSSCTFKVTVVDNEKPLILCPRNITVTTEDGACSAIVVYNVTATDNYPGVVTKLKDGLASNATFPVGVTKVSWLATDAAGNTSTCSFTVTVLGGPVPAINKEPTNQTVCANESAVFNVAASNAAS